ncbi:unnamed protein product [Absidia cylindrospora]
MDYTTDLDAPRAAWLFKMTHTSFGRIKWAPRYFILLDTEIRYYKDEYTDTPSQVLHLSNVRQIIPLMDRPNTFRLEPTLDSYAKMKQPLTIECSSHDEMELWYKCIHHRLSLAPVFSPPSFSFPSKKRSAHHHHHQNHNRHQQNLHHFFKKSLKSSSSTPTIPSHTSYVPIPSLSQQRRGVIIPTSLLPPSPAPSTSLHPLDLPSSSTTSSPYFIN